MAPPSRLGWCACALTSAAALDLSVNLSSAVAPMEHRAAGILHSLSSETPADGFLAPLSIRLFRGTADEVAESASRLHALGVRQFQVVVSDAYGYEGPWPGDDSYEKWDQVIDEAVEKVAGVEGVAFDLWNEPNGGPVPAMQGFWKRSKQQFFDTWQHGVQRLRARVPNATIVGPSSNTVAGGIVFGAWGEQWMHDFLTFAHQNDVLPDVVSWHELLPSVVEPRHGYVLIEEVQKLRSWMAQAGIPARPISINEYTPQDANTKPGTTVGFMAALERSGVESAAHSCWNDDASCGSEFESNCWSGTLDGLLSCPERKPRATWWVYEAYGGMAGTSMTVDHSSNADGIASLDGSRSRLLVGAHVGSRRAVSVAVTGVPRELQAGASVSVTVRRVSGTDWLPLDRPEVVSTDTVEVVHGQFLLSLDASPEDAFIVDLAKPDIVV